MKSNKKTTKINSSCSVVYLKVYTHTHIIRKKRIELLPVVVCETKVVGVDLRLVWISFVRWKKKKKPKKETYLESSSTIYDQEETSRSLQPRRSCWSWSSGIPHRCAARLQKDIDSLKPRFNCNTTIDRTVLLTNTTANSTYTISPSITARPTAHWFPEPIQSCCTPIRVAY